MEEILLAIILYLFIILFVYSESGLFIGLMFPGDSILFSAGLLAAAGYMNVGIVLFAVIIAAIAGDIFAYLYGQSHKKELTEKQHNSFWFRKKHRDRAVSLYKKHGPQTIILARFFPVIRSFMPMIAGVSKLRITDFILHTFIGVMLWASINIGIGFLLGRFVPGIGENILVTIIAVVAISITPNIIQVMREKESQTECMENARKSFALIFTKSHYKPLISALKK